MEQVDLNKLCQINIGKTPSRANPRYWGKGHKWLAISDMKSKYVYKTKEEITDLAIQETKIKVVPKNTVIMSFKLSIGKLAITQEEIYTNEAIASFPIISSDKITPDYLFYALKTLKWDSLTDRAVKGATLNKAKLNQLKIPLPTLEVQHRIVKILKKAEELIEKQRSRVSALSSLLQSVFLDNFGDPLINSYEYETDQLMNICVDIKGGGTPSKSKPEYYNGNIPWVTPKDMKRVLIEDSIDHINSQGIENSSAKLIPVNSLLMVIRSGILKKHLPVAINKKEVSLNQDMKAFILNKEVITPEYLLLFFQNYQKKLLSQVRSVTADNLDFNQIKRIEVPIPPIDKQKEFVYIFNKINSLIQKVQEQTILQEELFNSLIQRIFQEELLGAQ
ncbi:restriction endonuclease subunit S [Priestia megaterium]|uniref:restriction endonuclease subunit S n=1 Tax=Priestia megaterium TaxID=1404 RepID=UPI0027802770|nr:restriction endonuclease subunit S [Priestia megaterium]MDQ0802749.1 type I restriction enzyme S subunit [Priestia megaterium]